MNSETNCVVGHGKKHRIQVEDYWEHVCLLCGKVLGYEYPGQNVLPKKTGVPRRGRY